MTQLTESGNFRGKKKFNGLKTKRGKTSKFFFVLGTIISCLIYIALALPLLSALVIIVKFTIFLVIVLLALCTLGLILLSDDFRAFLGSFSNTDNEGVIFDIFPLIVNYSIYLIIVPICLYIFGIILLNRSEDKSTHVALKVGEIVFLIIDIIVFIVLLVLKFGVKM